MKVLVIYDLVPEDNYRAVVEMTDDEYAYFSKAHGIFINGNDNDNPLGREASLAINNAFCSDPESLDYCESDKEREYFGKWVSDLTNVDIKGVEKLISSGFYL